MKRPSTYCERIDYEYVVINKLQVPCNPNFSLTTGFNVYKVISYISIRTTLKDSGTSCFHFDSDVGPASSLPQLPHLPQHGHSQSPRWEKWNHSRIYTLKPFSDATSLTHSSYYRMQTETCLRGLPSVPHRTSGIHGHSHHRTSSCPHREDPCTPEWGGGGH